MILALVLAFIRRMRSTSPLSERSMLMLILSLICHNRIPSGKLLEEADVQFVVVKEPPWLRLEAYHQNPPPKGPEPRRGLLL